MNKNRLITSCLIVVSVLFAFTSCNKLKNSASDNNQSGSANNGSLKSKIAYVELDTLIKNYDMTNEVKASMETKQKQRDADFSNKSRAFQMEVSDFKAKAQKGLLSQNSIQDMQQQLGAKEQDLYKLQDEYRNEQAEDNQAGQRKLLVNIMDYLKIYNKSKGYQYILANTFPSTLLFADSTLNITAEVSKGLNEKYRKENKK